LKAQKLEPPSEKEKIALDMLRDDPKARVAFVDKIAAPVLNKMFECSMNSVNSRLKFDRQT